MTRKLFISSSEAVPTILASASGGPCGGSTAGERPDHSRCSSTSCAWVYLPNGPNRRHTHALGCQGDAASRVPGVQRQEEEELAHQVPRPHSDTSFQPLLRCSRGASVSAAIRVGLIQNVAVQQGHVDEVEEDLLPEALGWTLSRHVVDLTVAEVHPTHVHGVRNHCFRLQLGDTLVYEFQH